MNVLVIDVCISLHGLYSSFYWLGI